MYNYGDHEIDCHGTVFFSFSYNKIILFEKKHDMKLINLISMYHLKPLVSLDRFIKNQNADVQIARCTDSVQIRCITTLLGIIL